MSRTVIFNTYPLYTLLDLDWNIILFWAIVNAIKKFLALSSFHYIKIELVFVYLFLSYNITEFTH